MSRLLNVFGWRISTEALDVRLGQWVCFVGAPTVLLLTIAKLSRISVTEGEALMGILASLAVALALVILGIVLPFTQRKPTEQQAAHNNPSP